MNILTILYRLFISPLGLLFEAVFSIVNKHVSNPGFAIIVLSLLVNLLVLPLYNRADKIQNEQNETEKKLAPGIAHIRKSFTGDERFMMLQMFYKVNNYHPIMSLRSALSLLLQIPFFIAAYNFLSGLGLLQGVAFGPISDLGAPDAMLHAGAFAINVLPVLMTLINIVSGAIYTRGQPVKAKIQLYGMALIFLVLLYNSPAGLVFYWTLNNVFSLLKNVVTKLLPVKARTLKESNYKGNKFLFLGSSLYLTALTGLLLPSQVIKSSAMEFTNKVTLQSPVSYIYSSLILAAGFFIVWNLIFYYICSSTGKKYYEMVLSILVLVFSMEAFAYGRNYGMINNTLVYDSKPVIDIVGIVINLLFIVLIATVIWLCVPRFSKTLGILMLLLSVGLIGDSMLSVYLINYEVSLYDLRMGQGTHANWSLSTEGENVLLIMVDRGIGSMVPYVMDEFPELETQLDGFTYYENSYSYGGHTIFGAPALFGGYEYTPYELELRSDEYMVDKHNEALLVMPQLFADNGYDVTVINPPFAGYSWIPDLSIYDSVPNTTAYYTGIAYNDTYAQSGEANAELLNRNFFCYSIFRCCPELLKTVVYDDGHYNICEVSELVDMYSYSITDREHATGFYPEYMNAYNFVLEWDNETNITNDATNNFVMLTTDIAHDVQLLQEPEYVPELVIDNSDFDGVRGESIVFNDRLMHYYTYDQRVHYQASVRALLELGEYFDFLREQGVYDNTRIIIVSDHGFDAGHFDDYLINTGDREVDLECYNCMLMVKDFGSTGFSINSDFITNADTPYIATEGIIDGAANPFTGREFETSDSVESMIIISSDNWNSTGVTSVGYDSAHRYEIRPDVLDARNWEYMGEF